jgi:N-acetylneuraminate synthase
MDNIFIIAEAGVNHNGYPDRAFDLVDIAIDSGADAIKFQTFKTENIVTKYAPKAKYQQQEVGTQFNMLKELELSYKVHHKLFKYCKKNHIEMLSTAFDLESLDFLVSSLNLKTLKIASGEITNGPLLLAHARTGCHIILSTGMANLIEIEKALGVLAFGFMCDKNTGTPSHKEFSNAYSSLIGKKLLRERVTLLHCTTEYPAPLKDINLNAILTMRDAFNLKIGYSDHSEGIVVPTAAAALGAVLIEKHFTSDKLLPGPDHKASLSPSELKNMVLSVRTVERVLGDGTKFPTESELKNIPIARKSLVSTKIIQKGEIFTKENISTKRPGFGVSPMHYWDFLGNKSKADYNVDDIIDN